MKRALWLVVAVLAIGSVSSAKDPEKPGVDPELAKRVEALVAELEDPSFEAREQATLALAELGPEAAPALEPYLRHPSIEVQSRVRQILLRYKEMERQAAVGDAASTDWPMLKRGPGRSASDGLGGVRRAPKIRWAATLPFEIGQPWFDSPLLAVEDRVYAVGRSGEVACLSAEDGRIRWTSETGEAVAAAPVLAGGMIFLSGKNLTAMDAANGRIRWRWKTDYGCSASALAFGGRVYAVEKGERLVALDPANGEEQWSVRLHATSSAPVAVGGFVVVGSEEGLTAFRATDGQRRWRFETPSPVRTSPAVLPDRIVMGDAVGNVYAVTTDRGRKIWERAIPEGDIVEAPAVYGDAILFATSGRTFRALRAADGMDLWTRFVGTLTVSSPCVSGGIVYFTGGPRIHAMYCADGDDVWREQFVNLFSAPILVAGNLYMVTHDGVVVSLK